jgi:hypothetical protein
MGTSGREMPALARSPPPQINSRSGSSSYLSILNYIVTGSLLFAIFLKFSLHSVPEVHVTKSSNKQEYTQKKLLLSSELVVRRGTLLNGTAATVAAKAAEVLTCIAMTGPCRSLLAWGKALAAHQ